MKNLAYFAMLLVLAHSTTAFAQEVTSLSAVEQIRISKLMNRALEAGRKEAEAAFGNEHLSVNDRRDAQSQFAMMLMTMGQCEQTLQFVRAHEEIRASGIERLITKAELQGTRGCIPALAEIMLNRAGDSYFTPEGQISIRYRAAAYLDAAGRTAAKATMKAAEDQMMALPGRSMLWDARFNAIKAYTGTPRP